MKKKEQEQEQEQQTTTTSYYSVSVDSRAPLPVASPLRTNCNEKKPWELSGV
jgi:hypothetical protein